MSTALLGALALLLPTTHSDGPHESSDWATLDSDLSELYLQDEDASAPVSGWIRVAWSTDDLSDSGDEEISEFDVIDARIQVKGSLTGGASYKLEMELGETPEGGPTRLLDAFVSVPIAGDFNVTVGNFRRPFLRSALVDSRHLLFFNRTISGGFAAVRQQGISIERKWEGLHVAVAVQDGSDGNMEKLVATGRAAFDVVGQGVGPVEGAQGAPEELSGMVAVAVSVDESVDDGEAFAIEAAMTYGALSMSAEVVDYGSDYVSDGSDDGPVGFADQRSRSATISYMLRPRTWEAAWRIDYTDSLDNFHQQTFGLNYYVEGHDLKWSANLVTDEPDGVDDEVFLIGLTGSF